jgi:hypothetical protein
MQVLCTFIPQNPSSEAMELGKGKGSQFMLDI